MMALAAIPPAAPASVTSAARGATAASRCRGRFIFISGIYEYLATLAVVQFFVGRTLGSNQVIKVFALPIFCQLLGFLAGAGGTSPDEQGYHNQNDDFNFYSHPLRPPSKVHPGNFIRQSWPPLSKNLGGGPGNEFNRENSVLFF